MTHLKFTKMQGAGNDFVVVDATREPFSLNSGQIRFVADRRFGVGCDQLLVVEPGKPGEYDFTYRIFNANGGEVEQCGNGARCFAVFVREKGLSAKETIRVRTMKGVIEATVCEDGRVRIDMGAPRFAPQDLPMNDQGLSRLPRAGDTLYQIRTGSGDHWMSIVSMGNPHAVKLVGDVDQIDEEVQEVGGELQSHEAFPQQVNVGFLQPVDASHARLRVYERGAGETYACGTGACAAAVAGMRRGIFENEVEISMRGGDLRISWDQDQGHVYLTGPATIVFEGEIDVPENCQ